MIVAVDTQVGVAWLIDFYKRVCQFLSAFLSIFHLFILGTKSI